MEMFKTCPKCGKTKQYKNVVSYEKSIKENKPCQSCAKSKRYSREILEKACKGANGIDDVLLNLDVPKRNKSYILQLLREHQIEIPKSRIGTPPKFTEDVVMIACEGAKDYDDVAARLGIDGSYVYTLVNKFGLSVQHKSSGRPDIYGTGKFRKEIRDKTLLAIKELFESTMFLEDLYDHVTYTQRTWHRRNNDYTPQYCICGQLMIFIEKRYKYCSVKCSSQVSMQKAAETNMQRFGVPNAFQAASVKQKIQDTCLLRYGVPNGGLNSDKGYYKDYMLPSGRMIRIQGYENRALDVLLKKYDESDILYGPKEIHAHFGLIKYKMKKKEFKYFPDFYIKSENKIVEVKSTWTYDRKGSDKILRRRNELKRDACLKRGFLFEFMIF